MRLVANYCLALLLIASCNPRNKPAGYETYRTLPEGTGIQYENQTLLDEHYTSGREGSHPGLDSLIMLRLEFFDDNTTFDMKSFRSFWENFRQEAITRELTGEEAVKWFDLTGFLFQITAEALVAEELQRIVWQNFLNKPGADPDSLILPYVFTRNTDRVHVNLFLPGEVSFTHSLGGMVSVSLETSFPESGKMKILFETETKQFIELFILIPSWAKDASVTVKGVKYPAPQGSYSRIAKKWKDGDAVEVELPLENLPVYMKPGS